MISSGRRPACPCPRRSRLPSAPGKTGEAAVFAATCCTETGRSLGTETGETASRHLSAETGRSHCLVLSRPC